jgi:hypothetical protein
MKGVYVSVETIAIIISVVTMLIALAGGFGWMVQRMDTRFAEVNARFGEVNDRFGEVNERLAEVNARIDRIADEVVEVKVAVARLEGPQRHLIPAR